MLLAVECDDVRAATQEAQVQATRKAILEILKERGQATVDELAEQLDLTPMTVRHHLKVLQSEDLVAATRLQYSRSAGRPCHVYTLTERGIDFFPTNYHGLASLLLDEVKELMDEHQVQQIFNRIGEKLAADAPNVQGLPLAERVAAVSRFLTSKGFISRWEKVKGGYALYQFNCPYRRVSREHAEVCLMDMTLVSALLGVKPKRMDGTASAGEYCAYFIPADLTRDEK